LESLLVAGSALLVGGTALLLEVADGCF